MQYDSPKLAYDASKVRMTAEILQYQRDTSTSALLNAPKTSINAFYMQHASCHIPKTCFKCQKKGKRNHICGPACECRFRLPDRKHQKTTIDSVRESVVWYTWKGVPKQQPIIQFLPKRTTFDLFQNVSCPAITHSKFSCNNNLSLITDGPIAQYMFKYHLKPTQDSETEDYMEVE